MNHALDLFTELFYSNEVWGFTGPLIFVIVGFYLTKKDKNLGLAWFIVCLLMASIYLPEIVTYPWHIFILVFGSALTCLVPQLSR